MCKPLKREIKAVQTAAYGRVCDQIHDVYSMLLHGVLKPVVSTLDFCHGTLSRSLKLTGGGGLAMTNVTNFTGPRSGPTPLDFEELAGFFEEFKVKARAGELESVAMIVGRVDGTIRIARMTLPGANNLSILGGTYLLVFEILQDVAQMEPEEL